MLFCVQINAQISPGDLTNAHAKFEGLSNCTKCHVLGEQVSNSKCLDCHSEIRANITSGKGYHSSPDMKGKHCYDCHSEHHGRNFRIINFNKNNFDHNRTGFVLTGQHAKESCTSCHQTVFIKNSSLLNRKNSYLGLEARCASCHEDYHQNTLNNDCSACHNTYKFKPAINFNHDNVAFKLTGAHLKVECLKCHPKEKKGGKDYQRFKGIVFVSCANCHKDVHQGNFGNHCKTCHSTNSFKNFSEASFNHDITKFPLLGKHKTASCQSCHKNDAEFKPKHDKCIDCHKDFHKGEFVSEGNIKDCKECHNENSFTPSLFTIEQHNKGKFKLTGAHLAIPCISCHLKKGEYYFNSLATNCIDCHKNVHGAEINAKNMPGNNCLICHQTSSWKSITYDHDKTEFKLIGKHSNLSCTSCHVKNKNYIFMSVKTDCAYCHRDIHFDQFKDGQSTDCLICHRFDDWVPVNFDHAKTRFSLDGAHSRLNCTNCHKQVRVNGNSFIRYKLEDVRCVACHH